MTSETDDLNDEIEGRPQQRREWSGVLRSLIVPVLAVAAIVAVLWYLSARGSSTPATRGLGLVALSEQQNPTGKAPVALEGRAAPDFVLKTLDDKSVRLSDYRGQVVLINFWATWCGPCRKEMPDIVKAYDTYKDRGFTVLAVNVQEAEGPVRTFASEFGMNFPIPMDTNGQVTEAYRLQGLPTSFFIDKAGVIRQIFIGPMTYQNIVDYLEKLSQS